MIDGPTTIIILLVVGFIPWVALMSYFEWQSKEEAKTRTWSPEMPTAPPSGPPPPPPPGPRIVSSTPPKDSGKYTSGDFRGYTKEEVMSWGDYMVPKVVAKRIVKRIRRRP